MAVMSQLPPEVLTIIARAVVAVDEPRPPALHQSLADLASLAAVSKVWNAVVFPILYTQAIIQDVSYIGKTGASSKALCNIPPEMKTNFKIITTTHDHQDEGEEHHDDQENADEGEGRPWRECHLMTATTNGDLALLSRLASFITKVFPKMNVSSLLSAGFRVPWRCAQPNHYPEHDWNNEDEGLPEATLLHTAAAKGYIGVAEWLLNQGVEVDADAHLCCICPARIPITQCDATPLMLAISHNHIEMAKVLIYHGAMWNRCFRRTEDVTALHLIAAHGMAEMVDWLVAALDKSVRHTELGVLLASNGPHHDWPDEMGLWVLHHAISYAFLAGMNDSNAEDECMTEDHVQRLITGLGRLGAVRRTMDPERWRHRVSLELERMELKVEGKLSSDKHINAADMEWLEQIEWSNEQDDELAGRDITAEPDAFMVSHCVASKNERIYKVVLEVLNWEDN